MTPRDLIICVVLAFAAIVEGIRAEIWRERARRAEVQLEFQAKLSKLGDDLHRADLRLVELRYADCRPASAEAP